MGLRRLALGGPPLAVKACSVVITITTQGAFVFTSQNVGVRDDPDYVEDNAVFRP